MTDFVRVNRGKTADVRVEGVRLQTLSEWRGKMTDLVRVEGKDDRPCQCGGVR